MSTCQDCGSTSVRWTEGQFGWYLENVSFEYDNGARYSRGSHKKTCKGSEPPVQAEGDFRFCDM